MTNRTITLDLDPDDFAAVNEEFASRTEASLPEGGSNPDGARVAEIVRDLNEYRDLFPGDRERLKKAEAMLANIAVVCRNYAADDRLIFTESKQIANDIDAMLASSPAATTQECASR